MSTTDGYKASSQLGNSEAGALQVVSRGQYHLEPNAHNKEILATIREVLMLEDFPEDKLVEMEVTFKVVPETMRIRVIKK